MTPLRCSVLVSSILTTILAACVPITGAPGNATLSAANPPKPGDVETFIVREGDQETQRLTYRAVALEDSVPGDVPLTMVLESATAGAASTRAGATATAAEVTTFLRDHWDHHVGGKDDAGLNGQEFHTLLLDNGLEVARFLQLWRESRLSLADFTRFLTVLDQALGDADHAEAVRDLRLALGRYHVSLGDLMSVLAKQAKGTTVIPLPEAAVTTFFQRLQAQQLTVMHLFFDAVMAKKDLATAVQDVLAVKTQAMAPSASLPNLQSYTPSWNVVKDSKPTDITGFFKVPDTSIMFQPDCTSFTTPLRSLVTARGATVAQWRLYATGVCYPTSTFGMSSLTRIGEIGVKDLSFPDSRYRAYMSMSLGKDASVHSVNTSLQILLAGVIPLPLATLDDFDSLSRANGFSQPSEVKLSFI